MRAALATLAAGLALLGAAGLEARRAEQVLALSEAERDGAVGAVGEFVTLATHLAGSGGDPRFAERIPAAQALVEEILADVAFTRHEGRIEEHQLVRLQVEGVERAEESGVEVLTREYWVVRSTPLEQGVADKQQVRADVVRIRYLVVPEGSRWRVASWSVEGALAGDRPEGG